MSGYAVINGQQRQLANNATLVQPPINAPVLTQANEIGSTSATATAEPANGVTYTRVSACTWIWAAALCTSPPGLLELSSNSGHRSPQVFLLALAAIRWLLLCTPARSTGLR